jgi:hypothetical protein
VLDHANTVRLVLTPYITLQADSCITCLAYRVGAISSSVVDVLDRQSVEAEAMTNTQSLSAQHEVPTSSKQYSLIKILAIWASVTAPMALLAWVVGPALIPHTSLHPGLVHWMLIVVGMMWQFVVSLAILNRPGFIGGCVV